MLRPASENNRAPVGFRCHRMTLALQESVVAIPKSAGVCERCPHLVGMAIGMLRRRLICGSSSHTVHAGTRVQPIFRSTCSGDRPLCAIFIETIEANCFGVVVSMQTSQQGCLNKAVSQEKPGRSKRAKCSRHCGQSAQNGERHDPPRNRRRSFKGERQ